MTYDYYRRTISGVIFWYAIQLKGHSLKTERYRLPEGWEVLR